MAYWHQYAPPPAGSTPTPGIPPPNSGPWPANFQSPPPQQPFNYAGAFQHQQPPRSQFHAPQLSSFNQTMQQRPPPPIWSQPPPPMQQQMPRPSGWPPLPPWGNVTQPGALPQAMHCPLRTSLLGDPNLPDPKGNALLNILPPWMRDKVEKYEESRKLQSEKEGVPAVRPVDILRDAIVAVGTLRQLKASAQLHIESDEVKWTAIMSEVRSCQNKLKALCEELSKENVLGDLKVYAQKRHKKRERQRRQVIIRKQEKEEAEKHTAQQEARINAYRRRVVEKALHEKQEAEMKEEADSILSEIRFKISRTREYLEKLSALEQLREARKDSYRRKGLYVAAEADKTFAAEISSVRTLLERQLVDYQKEETALKVMLESEQKEQHETKKLQAKEAAVLGCLFGNQEVEPVLYPFYQYYCSPMNSMEAFIANREAWDRYLLPPNCPQGGSVPVQWVKPDKPSSQLWAEYCTSDT